MMLFLLFQMFNITENQLSGSDICFYEYYAHKKRMRSALADGLIAFLNVSLKGGRSQPNGYQLAW